MCLTPKQAGHYHGYQSFAAGEVTPDEAHAIGMETARQMWGARYQVVVTTHLNTDNIHNHFVINSVTALYCRLSVEDIKDENGKKKRNIDESNSISNQKQILSDYAKKHGYTNTMFFVDDGISGTSFDRSAFNRMQRMVEEGKIGTIIVKDLSRFGREHIEGGRLAEIVYPTLGVTFISIHENVNTSTGEGMEMMPFYNIFNEWYAAQTSKKIRDVWKSKSDNGKRVSPTVPFGYMKDPADKEKWLIDEPAAEIVRKIFALCLDGRGPSQIARQLEKENIMVPAAYYQSVNRKCSQKVPIGSCHWDTKTIVHILENRQYSRSADILALTASVRYSLGSSIFSCSVTFSFSAMVRTSRLNIRSAWVLISCRWESKVSDSIMPT